MGLKKRTCNLETVNLIRQVSSYVGQVMQVGRDRAGKPGIMGMAYFSWFFF